jgi:hypothetical protein
MQKDFLIYLEAKKIVRELGIYSPRDYRKKYKQFEGLPSNPPRLYQKEWISWKSFLPRFRFVSFEECLIIMKRENVQNVADYKKIQKNTRFRLPSHPHIVYNKPHSLIFGSSKNIRYLKPKQNFLSYIEASNLVKEKGIKNQAQYKLVYNWYNLPANPYETYRNEWKGWIYFLQKFASFEEAKKIVREANLKSENEYLNFRKQNLHLNLHSKPDKFYQEWISWPDFFGKNILFTTKLRLIGFSHNFIVRNFNV